MNTHRWKQSEGPPKADASDELIDTQVVSRPWRRRWLSVSISALLTVMALLTAASLTILYRQTSKITSPDAASDVLTIYQASSQLEKLNDSARELLAGETSADDFLLRMDVAASLFILDPDIPRNNTPFIDNVEKNRYIRNLLANVFEHWSEHLADPEQIVETAQSVLDNKAYIRTQIDRLAMAVHISNSDARDTIRLRLYSGFHQLRWALGGLILGSLILSIWLVRSNRLAALLNYHLSQVNVSLEGAVARRTKQLAWLASTDFLTGLKNRRAFMEAGELLTHQQHRYGHGLAALVLDIDHFKKINDLHGHHIGDQAIRRVTEAIARTLRESDVFGRIGGEEFAVLMPHTSLLTAGHVANRVRQAVSTMKIGLEVGGPLQLTISIGVASADRTSSLETLLMQADAALYHAKALGRDRFEMFESVEQEEIRS